MYQQVVLRAGAGAQWGVKAGTGSLPALLYHYCNGSKSTIETSAKTEQEHAKDRRHSGKNGNANRNGARSSGIRSLLWTGQSVSLGWPSGTQVTKRNQPRDGGFGSGRERVSPEALRPGLPCVKIFYPLVLFMTMWKESAFNQANLRINSLSKVSTAFLL